MKRSICIKISAENKLIAFFCGGVKRKEVPDSTTGTTCGKLWGREKRPKRWKQKNNEKEKEDTDKILIEIQTTEQFENWDAEGR